MRHSGNGVRCFYLARFPLPFGRDFREATALIGSSCQAVPDFPSFWEGLSLRLNIVADILHGVRHFPSFWEGLSLSRAKAAALRKATRFPFLFGRDFH